MIRESTLNELGITEEYFKRKFKYKAFHSSEWKNYSSKWRLIQNLLPAPFKICPICGKIFGRKFKQHLKIHNLTPEDWYCLYYNIKKEIHKCKNCDCELSFKDDQYIYPDFCSKSCRLSYTDKWMNRKRGNPYNPYQWTEEQIRARGYTGRSDPRFKKDWLDRKSALASAAVKSRNKKYGNNWACSSWTNDQILARGYSGRDDPKYKARIKKWLMGCIKGGKISVMKSRGTWNKVLLTRFHLNDKVFNLKSGAEFWLLLYLLVVLKVDPNTIKYEVKYKNPFNKTNAKSDFEVIRDGIKENHEIHSIHDAEVIANKRLCTESSGVKFILYDLLDQYKLKAELRNHNISVTELNSQLFFANKAHRQYEYYYKN